MGKAQKPLTIYVHPDFAGQAWPIELQAKGHRVLLLGSEPPGQSVLDADLILAPQACRFVPGMEFMLDEMVKGARKMKYPVKEKP